MKELQDRIIAYVTASNCLVSLEKLLTVSMAKGFSEGEVLAALSVIGKKLKSTVRGNEVYYQVPPVAKTPTDHLAWVNQWYKDNPQHCTEVPFPSIDYSHLFLKTKEERDAYLAAAKGMPVHMVSKKKYGNAGR